MNILQAMADEALFAPAFRGGSWEPWRAFLGALFGLPLSDDQLAFYRRHTGRSEPPTAAFREASLVCGRRGGKSRVMAAIAVFLSAFKTYSAHLAPGEVATVAVIAADRRQARTVFRYIVGLLRSVPMLADLIEEEASDRLALTNGVEIEVSTASFRSTRGFTYAAVICDEIAFWRAEDSANPDAEIVKAIRPGLSTIPGSVLLMASSPYAQRGVLYDTFRRHYGKDDARVLVWKASTAEMNPALDPAIVAEAYEDDPAAASAEYGADFRTDIVGYVTREVVDGCTVPGRFELPPISAHRYVAFVDPSGGSSDSMTLALAHAERDGAGRDAPVRAVLDAVREARPPFSPEAVVNDFCSLLRAYGVGRVRGDRYGGEWPREQFRKQGIAYDLSEKPKSDLYRDVLPLLNSGRAELLDLPKLGAQLAGLERRTARGGRDSIDHPPGGHDDVANAAAGALLATAGAGASVLERARVLLR